MQRVLAQAVINKPSYVIPSWGPDPKKPKQRIAPSEWPTVVRRLTENHESLRTVAHDYGVSHETVRCILLASRNKDGGERRQRLTRNETPSCSCSACSSQVAVQTDAPRSQHSESAVSSETVRRGRRATRHGDVAAVSKDPLRSQDTGSRGSRLSSP
jgi:hypothetical protein